MMNGNGNNDPHSNNPYENDNPCVPEEKMPVGQREELERHRKEIFGEDDQRSSPK